MLYERAAYDAAGNFLTGTYMDYLLPTSTEIPLIEIEHLDPAKSCRTPVPDGRSTRRTVLAGLRRERGSGW